MLLVSPVKPPIRLRTSKSSRTTGAGISSAPAVQKFEASSVVQHQLTGLEAVAAGEVNFTVKRIQVIQQPRSFRPRRRTTPSGRHTNGGTRIQHLDHAGLAELPTGDVRQPQGISPPSCNPTKIDPASAANVLRGLRHLPGSRAADLLLQVRRPAEPKTPFWSVFGDNVGLPQATFNGLTLGVQITGERGIIKIHRTHSSSPCWTFTTATEIRSPPTTKSSDTDCKVRVPWPRALEFPASGDRTHRQPRALPSEICRMESSSLSSSTPHFRGTIRSRTAAGSNARRSNERVSDSSERESSTVAVGSTAGPPSVRRTSGKAYRRVSVTSVEYQAVGRCHEWGPTQ